MPKIEQEISAQAKRTFNRLKKEYGEDFVVENLLNDYKNFESSVAEKEILEQEVEALKKSKKESPAEMQNNGSTDVLAILNKTIEVYARENERLLKIVNFSDYDEKINNLKNKILEQSSSIKELKYSLKAEKENSVNLELKSLKLEEEKQELLRSLESQQAKVSDLIHKVAALESEKTQRDATITSYSDELEKYKALVEELKAQIPIARDSKVETATYS